MTDQARKRRAAWRKTNKLKRARFHGLALIACALFLITGLAIVDDYGVSADTDPQRDITLATLNYILNDDPTLLRRAADHLYGVAFEAPLLLLTERVLGLEDPRHVYLARHVLTHLFFLLGGFCCYLLARRLSGDRLVALLVMALFLLSPRLYAHSFFNSKDPVFASAFVMALLVASRAFDKDSVGAYRWCGAAAGLLVNLRVMGVVLFAVVLVFRAWAWFRAGGRGARRRVVATAGVFALWGGLVLFISLPYLWGDPVGRLSEYWTVLANHPVVSYELFRGQVFSSAALPWDYVLHWFAISQPPVTLLLGLLGLVALGLAAGGVVRRGAGAGPGMAWGGGGRRVAPRHLARNLFCIALGCLCSVAAHHPQWLAAFLFSARAVLPAGDLRPDGVAPAVGAGGAKRMDWRRGLRADGGGAGRRGGPDGADPSPPISLFQLFCGPEDSGTIARLARDGLLEYDAAAGLRIHAETDPGRRH